MLKGCFTLMQRFAANYSRSWSGFGLRVHTDANILQYVADLP